MSAAFLQFGVLLGISAAGALGALARFCTDAAVRAGVTARASRRGGAASAGALTLGILTANWVGSFLMGVLAGGIAVTATLNAILAVGFLGGYTTFSTACVDTAKLAAAQRYRAAALHLAATLGGSLALAWAGWQLAAAVF